jgi:hypothetical protein
MITYFLGPNFEQGLEFVENLYKTQDAPNHPALCAQDQDAINQVYSKSTEVIVQWLVDLAATPFYSTLATVQGTEDNKEQCLFLRAHFTAYIERQCKALGLEPIGPNKVQLAQDMFAMIVLYKHIILNHLTFGFQHFLGEMGITLLDLMINDGAVFSFFVFCEFWPNMVGPHAYPRFNSNPSFMSVSEQLGQLMNDRNYAPLINKHQEAWNRFIVPQLATEFDLE